MARTALGLLALGSLVLTATLVGPSLVALAAFLVYVVIAAFWLAEWLEGSGW